MCMRFFESISMCYFDLKTVIGEENKDDVSYNVL